MDRKWDWTVKPQGPPPGIIILIQSPLPKGSSALQNRATIWGTKCSNTQGQKRQFTLKPQQYLLIVQSNGFHCDNSFMLVKHSDRVHPPVTFALPLSSPHCRKHSPSPLIYPASVLYSHPLCTPLLTSPSSSSPFSSTSHLQSAHQGGDAC